ncbi:MAG: hypothetical protein WCD37_03665 [Chloroflexia bacterium]
MTTITPNPIIDAIIFALQWGGLVAVIVEALKRAGLPKHLNPWLALVASLLGCVARAAGEATISFQSIIAALLAALIAWAVSMGAYEGLKNAATLFEKTRAP